jgi:DNA-binding SARP family transcriptional activator
VVVISRNDPPARFYSLLAARSLNVLRWQDLRFTLPEFTGTARVLGDGGLSTVEIEKLHHELEGWVAGLVLTLEQVRLSGKGTVDLPRGTTGEILDYFASEIWDAVKPETRDLLVKTACFPFMTGAMAEELTGIPYAEATLSRLCANNFFTLRFEPGPRYRYHNLFREFLIRQLNDSMPYDDIVWLKKNAAALLLQEGYPEECAELLIEEKDWEALVSLVKQSASELFNQGRVQTIQGWLKRVPGPVRENHPWLFFWQARCALWLDPVDRRILFKKAFALFERDDEPGGLLLSWADNVMTYLHNQTRLEELDQLLKDFGHLKVHFESSRDDYVQFQVATSMLVALTLRQPNHPDLPKWARRVRGKSGTGLDFNTHVLFLLGLALRKYYAGDVAGFGAALEEVEKLTGTNPHLLPDNRAMSMLLMALRKWLEFRLEDCLGHVGEGLRISEKLGGTIWDGLLLGQQVNAMLSQGNLTEAKKGLELYRAHLDRLPPLSVSYYHQRMAWYCLARGDLDAALVNAQEGRRLAEVTGIPNNMAYALIMLAEVHAALGEENRAQNLLREAGQIGQNLGNNLVRFQCVLLDARLSYRSGREDEGDRRLARALGIGYRYGIANWQFMCLEETTKLFTRALTRGIETSYVLDLIRLWDISPSAELWELEAWPWPLKIYTLGHFEVLRNGELLRFEGKVQHKPLELLKAVIALGGRSVAAERIIEALWPDSTGAAGHGTLESNLHRLRKLLGIKDAVILKNGRLTLNPDLCWVDAWAFDRAFAASDTILDHETCRTAERAMELYRGTFLPNDDTHAWSVTLRERIQNKFLRLVQKYGTHLEGQGLNEQAIDCYLEVLDRCPLSENIYQRLMLCYERTGQKAEAVAACQRCRRILNAAHGIEPSRKTLELCERIKDSTQPCLPVPFHLSGK